MKTKTSKTNKKDSNITKSNSKNSPQKNKTIEITPHTILANILEIPGAEDILEKYNLPCLHCPMSRMEMGFLEIGQVCEMYGINVDDIIKELNKLVK